MKIVLVNCDIEWESPAINLSKYDIMLESILFTGEDKPDLIVFPEMFTTGFSVNEIGRASWRETV